VYRHRVPGSTVEAAAAAAGGCHLLRRAVSSEQVGEREFRRLAVLAGAGDRIGRRLGSRVPLVELLEEPLHVSIGDRVHYIVCLGLPGAAQASRLVHVQCRPRGQSGDQGVMCCRRSYSMASGSVACSIVCSKSTCSTEPEKASLIE
jgi:hypothetical protein